MRAQIAIWAIVVLAGCAEERPPRSADDEEAREEPEEGTSAADVFNGIATGANSYADSTKRQSEKYEEEERKRKQDKDERERRDIDRRLKRLEQER